MFQLRPVLSGWVVSHGTSSLRPDSVISMPNTCQTWGGISFSEAIRSRVLPSVHPWSWALATWWPVEIQGFKMEGPRMSPRRPEIHFVSSVSLKDSCLTKTKSTSRLSSYLYESIDSHRLCLMELTEHMGGKKRPLSQPLESWIYRCFPQYPNFDYT